MQVSTFDQRSRAQAALPIFTCHGIQRLSIKLEVPSLLKSMGILPRLNGIMIVPMFINCFLCNKTKYGPLNIKYILPFHSIQHRLKLQDWIPDMDLHAVRVCRAFSWLNCGKPNKKMDLTSSILKFVWTEESWAMLMYADRLTHPPQNCRKLASFLKFCQCLIFELNLVHALVKDHISWRRTVMRTSRKSMIWDLSLSYLKFLYSLKQEVPPLVREKSLNAPDTTGYVDNAYINITLHT